MRSAKPQRLEHPFAGARGVLLGVLQLALGDEYFFDLLEAAKARIFSCVVDSNVLVNDARAAAHHGMETPMLFAARIGTVNLFATTHVRDEVPRVIRDMAQEHGFEPAPVLRAWYDTCAPWIVFLDTVGLAKESARIRRLTERDASDTLTGLLVEVLDPDLFLTQDRDMEDFQIVAPTALKGLKVAFRDKSIADALLLGGGVGISVVVVGTFVGLSELIKLLLRAGTDRRLPFAALATIVLAGGALWLVNRRRITPEAYSQNLSDAPSGARDFLREVLESVGERMEAGEAAQETIKTRIRNPTPPRTALYYGARVLSRSAAPAQLPWLAERMKTEGYRPRRHPLMRSVEAQLQAHPRFFTAYDGNRWGLRSWPPAEPGK